MLPLVLMSNLPVSASAAFTIFGQKCGTKVCKIYQFCSKFHNTQCEDCSKICDASDHNYEEDICLEDCQSK